MTLYVWLLRLLAPLVLVRLAWRGLRNHDYWHRWGERFGFTPFHPEATDAPTIWLHAVSVGETRAAAPLVRALQSRYKERVLVTTTTPTGSAQVRALFGERVAHSYFPYDLPSAVRRFLDRARPRILIVMETELWPVVFHACRARGIAIVVVNLRMSESAMQRYRRFPTLTRATLAQANLFAVQTKADGERLRMLGAPPDTITVTGSLKFDLDVPSDLPTRAQELRAQWGEQRPVWIAASTHEGEEAQVLDAFDVLRARFPSLLLVLVPRHPERFAAAAHLARARYMTALRSEQRAALSTDVAVLIGDSMGELLLLLAAADVAFMGGSLVPTGGHNLVEPAAVGVPVVFGPHMFNFAEIAQLTQAKGAGRQVQDAQTLAAAIEDYLGDANKSARAGMAGKALVSENRGALEKTLALIAMPMPAGASVR